MANNYQESLAGAWETYERQVEGKNKKKKGYRIKGYNPSPVYLITKRIIDILASATGLILASPVMLLVAIAIKLDSPGPIIYSQVRVGKGGKEYLIFKFRSMVNNAEARTGAVWARKDDNRVTRVGKFIRKTRLDELPQLWNVLKGEMSLVGPRPERPLFVEKFEREHPGFKNRLLVKPGLTGLAQVNGGYDIKTPSEVEA